MTKTIRVRRTRLSEIWLDESGVLWLRPVPDADLDLDEVMACFAVYREMGISPQNKVLQIIDARGSPGMSKEGRDYAAEHGSELFVASAVIGSSLPVRLLVNFFNAFYKTQLVPLKLFDSEKSARKWFERFKA